MQCVTPQDETLPLGARVRLVDSLVKAVAERFGTDRSRMLSVGVACGSIIDIRRAGYGYEYLVRRDGTMARSEVWMRPERLEVIG